MSQTKTILYSLVGIALGGIVTLVVFGLLLALLWAVVPQSPAWKLVGALAAAALALCAGGFVLAWSSGRTGWLLPAAFGVLFGAFSFVYILGPSWVALVLTGASALFVLLGAGIFQRIFVKGQTHTRHEFG